ncbi:MAG: Hsp70 family protein, partial [Planctomycetes bacterium]|nr:Hsp70 family protein [Planctomycetota bacterium]
MYPSKLSWKQDMGTDATYELAGKSYTPISLSALILKQLKEAAEERLQEPIRGAVITIP